MLTCIRSSAALMLILVWTASASAQQDQTGGDTGTTTPGTGAGDGGGDGPAVLQSDAASEFTAVERGDTIGNTGETGAGFSELSVSPTGGARGGGGGGLGGGGGFGGLGALGNLFGGGFGAGAGQSTQPTIRTRLRSAVSVAPMQPAAVQRTASMRLRNLTTRPQLRGISVTMQGRTATLSGAVRSESDRRMSEMLMRLEPGVSRINNQVVVLPPQ